MATIESALRTRLQAVPGVASLIAGRIYPAIAPQDVVAPYVVYERLSTERLTTLSGPSGAVNPRFRITAWAADLDQARAVAKEIRLALDGYRGIVDGVRIKACSVVDEQDGIDTETFEVRDSLTLSIWHSEEA